MSTVMHGATAIFAVISVCLAASASGTDSNLNKTIQLVPNGWIQVDDESTPSSDVPDIFQNIKANETQLQNIINGLEAVKGRYPYLVSLQILYSDKKRYHVCSGVLIRRDTLLTAAHCTYYFGAYTHFAAVGYGKLSEPGEALVKVKSIITHPRYRPYSLGFPNDVALLKLEKNVKLTENVQLAKLARPREKDAEYQCTVPGWGYTEDDNYSDQLRYAPLYGLTNKDCKLFFKIFGNTGLKKKHKCAWLWPYAACYGDSGGPLICDGKVHGISSWSADCTGCFPTVFARVQSYYRWVMRTM